MQQTALINIEPRQDEVVLKLAEEAIRVWQYAQKMEVKTTEDVCHTTEDLSLIAGIKNQLEAKRKAFVQPLDKHRKSIQEKFKTITGPVEQADKVLRDKIGAFNTERRRLQEEAARAHVLIDEAKIIMDNITQQTGEVFEQPAGIIVPPVAPVQVVYTGVGSMTTRKTRKWEVVDFAALPDEYKVPDAAKIGKVVRAGMDKVPGVRIWEEEGLAITPLHEKEPIHTAEERAATQDRFREVAAAENVLEGGDAGQANDQDLPF